MFTSVGRRQQAGGRGCGAGAAAANSLPAAGYRRFASRVNMDMNANSRCPSTGDPQLDEAVRRWLTWDKVSASLSDTLRQQTDHAIDRSICDRFIPSREARRGIRRGHGSERLTLFEIKASLLKL